MRKMKTSEELAAEIKEKVILNFGKNIKYKRTEYFFQSGEDYTNVVTELGSFRVNHYYNSSEIRKQKLEIIRELIDKN